MKNVNLSKSNIVYEVKLKFGHLFLKSEIFQEIVNKINSYIKHIEPELLENNFLKNLKILDYPDLDNIYSTGIEIETMIKTIRNLTSSLIDPGEIVNLILEGKKSKKFDNIFVSPKSYLEQISESLILIDISQKMLFGLSKKLSKIQVYVEYHIDKTNNERDIYNVKKN